MSTLELNEKKDGPLFLCCFTGSPLFSELLCRYTKEQFFWLTDALTFTMVAEEKWDASGLLFGCSQAHWPAWKILLLARNFSSIIIHDKIQDRALARKCWYSRAVSLERLVIAIFKIWNQVGKPNRTRRNKRFTLVKFRILLTRAMQCLRLFFLLSYR